MLGIFKNEYMIEAYGKLPFYKDYISVITSTEASLWQEWLLRIFGQKNTLIPKGVWHFLFFPAKGAHLITGIIMQASDGIRNFPFSLFVTLSRSTIKNQLKWAELFAIKDDLIKIYKEVYEASDIQNCYATLSGLTLETRNKKIKAMYLDSVGFPDLKPFNNGQDYEFPNFSIISRNSITCLSRGNSYGNEIVSEWRKLMFSPDIQGPI